MAMRIAPLQCRLSSSVGLSSFAARRSLSSVAARPIRSRNTLRQGAALALPKKALQQSFRRGYAEITPGAVPTGPMGPAETVKPKRRFKVLRWIWRITYLSVLGSIGYITYVIYDGKHPNEQFEPDPSKKTLVILGKNPIYSDM